ncbi:MAG: formyltransferase [Geobacteraceae bacterium]
MSRHANVVVCAYHNVGFRCLQELLDQGAHVSAVFSHEDSASEEIWFESVQQLATRHQIPCYTTDVNLPENIELLRRIAPDFLFSFYYRSMIQKEILEIPRKGALNLHGSLLPKYRGRVPVNWAVIQGETETGATLHYMVEKPDAGDIVDQERVSIELADTALDVFHKVTEVAVRIIRRSWPQLLTGTAQRIPMDVSAGCYFGGRKPADGLIDWNKSSIEIYNLIRGVTHPYPGAFTYLDGEKVLIWRAMSKSGSGRAGEVLSEQPLLVGTGSGLLEVLSLQCDAEDEIDALQFVRKHSVLGKSFTSPQAL